MQSNVNVLREAGERSERMFRLSPSPITISRLDDGHYIEVNEAFLRTYGYNRAEAIGHSGPEPGTWPDRTVRDACMRAGGVHGHEAVLCTRSGDLRQVAMNTEQIELDGKKCLLTVIFDITERKRAEEARRRLEEQFALIFRNSPEAVTISSESNGRYVDVNGAFTR